MSNLLHRLQFFHPVASCRKFVSSLKQSFTEDKRQKVKHLEEVIEAFVVVLAVLSWLAAMTLLP